MRLLAAVGGVAVVVIWHRTIWSIASARLPTASYGSLIGAALERESGRQADGECSIRALTPREAQIALLVSEGLPNKLVAWQLNIAEGTVKVYLHNIYEKLGIPNRTALCALATPHRDWLTAEAEHAALKLN